MWINHKQVVNYILSLKISILEILVIEIYSIRKFHYPRTNIANSNNQFIK